MRLRQIDHIGISSGDPAATVSFYRDVLGFEAAHGGGPGVQNLRAGQVTLAVSSRRPGETAFARAFGDHFALDVEGTSDQIAEELTNRGVEFQRTGPRVYVRDPDGYVLELVAAR